jgi:hypothetical protein
MNDLEIQDNILLTTISRLLVVSPSALIDIYLRIKVTGKAAETDLNQLFSLGIPVYQAIFALAKKRKNQKVSSDHIRFSDVRTIMFSLVEENGLLSHKLDNTPRNVFSEFESREIKRLLKLARELSRKERQEILAQLRIGFRFFPSHLTKSRSRFDDKTFDQLVAKGIIVISS